MYLLYCDESGTTHDPNCNHFVFAGFATFEKQGYWFSQELDRIAARFDPADPNSIELHGSPMYTGRGKWRRIPKADRVQAITDALNVFARSNYSNRLFASVIRNQALGVADPVEFGFEQLASRFDSFLQRLHRKGDTQRGVMIFDKTTYEGTIQSLATDFRSVGHSWGVLRNLSEVPLFLDSKASRLIQLADLIAYAIFRYYEHGDNQFYSIISRRYDAEGGVIHGLREDI